MPQILTIAPPSKPGENEKDWSVSIEIPDEFRPQIPRIPAERRIHELACVPVERRLATVCKSDDVALVFDGVTVSHECPEEGLHVPAGHPGGWVVQF
jgi:hypothetical protein